MGTRRRFTKEFKEAALRRWELGASKSDVARACQVAPEVLKRWKQEARKYGQRAFSGYGKSRVPIEPKKHSIIFRLSPEEYNYLKVAYSKKRDGSLSEFVRSILFQETTEPSLQQIETQLGDVIIAVRRLTRTLDPSR